MAVRILIAQYWEKSEAQAIRSWEANCSRVIKYLKLTYILRFREGKTNYKGKWH